MTIKRRILDVFLRCFGIKIIYCCENCRHIKPQLKTCGNRECWLVNMIIPYEPRKNWKCELWE